MATVEEHVLNTNKAIEDNILEFADNNGLAAQNLLQYLRHLVEGLIVYAHVSDPSVTYNYNKQFSDARDAAKGWADCKTLWRLHTQLQVSMSHYTPNQEESLRLMLGYYDYLLRARDFAKQNLDLEILRNLEDLSLNEDPALRVYYEDIVQRIKALKQHEVAGHTERYYITSRRPFVIDQKTYYEVTFSRAHNRTSKFDRVLGFTDIDVSEYYAAKLEIANDFIEVGKCKLPITIVRDWSVSIRPCEFNNFARLLGQSIDVKSNYAEYRRLMKHLTHTGDNLLDLIDSRNDVYGEVKAWVLENSKHPPLIFPALDAARKIIQKDRPGARLLRYLMLRMNNQILKAQYHHDECRRLSGLNVSSKCRPFDKMPFCTSPRNHNPRLVDLMASIDCSSRRHELLARRVRANAEQHGVIYTPEGELEHLGNIDDLIKQYNDALPTTPRHRERELKHANGHVFIIGYENTTVRIIDRLEKMASSGIDGYEGDVDAWLARNAMLEDGHPQKIDDQNKANVLRKLFAHSKVALIYGAAGTGKSTMLNHIADYFRAERKLFLAHTNPAVDNLRSRIDGEKSCFSTITKYLWDHQNEPGRYHLLVIDECSTVSNAALLEVLDHTDFELLVLVGDAYQIESIEFGNWFKTVRLCVPRESVHELMRPFRTTDQGLLDLWKYVRELDDRIEEALYQKSCSRELGESLFKRYSTDEIVLCLNYGGLYGINNINRFLQETNPEKAFTWGENTYKVGDPVLFNETERFSPLIFNNMKGTIVGIKKARGKITFDVDLRLGRDVKESEALASGLRVVRGSVVQLDVIEHPDTDEDDDSTMSIVPFQIAYAVSIHKAQGLEFDSVKVVITEANEEYISHSVFYTAITRARKNLEIYWTRDSQYRILNRMEVGGQTKDEVILQQRRGVSPVARTNRQRRQQQLRKRERP